MKSIVLAAGMIAVPAVLSPQQTSPKPQPPDPRLLRLQQFFASRDCPLRDLASEFLVAADRYALDWRLLPSISFIESSGGKDYHNNNVFGWDSPLHSFTSIPAGIHYVAAQLARSDKYRNKTTEGKLRTYNPNPEYPAKVKAVMQVLGPSDPRLAAMN